MIYPQERSGFWESVSDVVVINAAGDVEHKLHRILLMKSKFFWPMIDPSSDFYTIEPIVVDVDDGSFQLLFRYLYREIHSLPRSYSISQFVKEESLSNENLLLLLMVTNELGFFDYIDLLFSCLDYTKISHGDLASLVEIFGYQKVPSKVVASLPISVLEQYPELLYAYYRRQYQPTEEREKQKKTSPPRAITKVVLKKQQ